jgi:hypothetical protein
MNTELAKWADNPCTKIRFGLGTSFIQATGSLSLSFFTIESDRRPVVAFAAKKHGYRQYLFQRRGGAPLCDDISILCIRLANAGERALYRGQLVDRP